MRQPRAVLALIAFQLGLSVGLVAGRTLWRAPDPPAGHLERLLRETEAIPRLEWQQ
jgi:hypothetical protein